MSASTMLRSGSFADEVIAAAREQIAKQPGLATFLARYFRHVHADDVTDIAMSDLIAMAMSHWQLSEHREPGTSVVRVLTPSHAMQGWAVGKTVVQVTTDDMPFLVDSLTAALVRRQLSITTIIHPQCVVRRDEAGTLMDVLPQSVKERHELGGTPGIYNEAWIQLTVEQLADPAAGEDLASALHNVLHDVRMVMSDWKAMAGTAVQVAAVIESSPPSNMPAAEITAAPEFVRWLAADNFTFLGYRRYALEQEGEVGELVSVPDTGLGILRPHASSPSSRMVLPPTVLATALERTLLVVTKANRRSTVHRAVYMDYVGVKTYDERGNITGEHRFLGLFAGSTYTDSVAQIPLVNTKVAEVLEKSGFSVDSHSGKDLQQILETYPRDELFQSSVEQLLQTGLAVIQANQYHRTRVFFRPDPFGRFLACVAYLPRDRYTTSVRLKITEVLEQMLRPTSIDYTIRVGESALARLYFVARLTTTSADVQVIEASLTEQIERQVIALTTSWDDDFRRGVHDVLGEYAVTMTLPRWAQAFPEGYRDDTPAEHAANDIRYLEELSHAIDVGANPERVLDLRLYNGVQTPGTDEVQQRMKVYRWAPMSLSRVMPYLADLGVEVTDERPYELHPQGSDQPQTAYVYDFGLRYLVGTQHGDVAKAEFGAAFAAAWREECESDGFNQLVLAAGLTWRQVVIVRTYAKYLQQLGTTFSLPYIQRALLANTTIAQGLCAYFAARFDPQMDDATRDERQHSIFDNLQDELDAVTSLDHDRIIRSILAMMQATVRTNFYQPMKEVIQQVRAQADKHEVGAYKDYVSIKVLPQQIPDAPLPRPAFEIFVYSPRLEGVHLRFGKVARGGLRWSDRFEDFRTEVLGLVKAQMVKNAVIVPTGAKGGFVAKRLPDPAVDRETWLAEGIRCYRTFICGLLDVTDNLVPATDGQPTSAPVVQHPEAVVRHDDDDTYLVVAADKGTATFSDIANEVAQGYSFWLGDAFASGGSVGYDHKAMGITARGAWESVTRHFLSLGTDVQTDPITVVGIGDMSGDVFGNGMLLSSTLRLVAAFDHRDIFLDPDPDPGVSFAERQRLFALPRSSWADYQTTLISPGGGVFSRSAKSIPISPQVAKRLGLSPQVTQLTPTEVLRAILQAPVDLLWNGGIGTYVKASSQSHFDAGDKANDPIRIDGRDLRCLVIGEGGNLGITHLGRIEAALAGVRVNTDAIDNSAGVDCSDHEVNIKILLDSLVASAELTVAERDVVLAEMTDEVAELVLADNYQQNMLLALGRLQAPAMFAVHQRLMHYLEEHAALDRELEFLPTDEQLLERHEHGVGLTSPELAVLIAYAKINLQEQLLRSDVPEDPWLERWLVGYFPQRLRGQWAAAILAHPLRRELIATIVANHLVNHSGSSMVMRTIEETGASVDQVVRAYLVTYQVFRLDDFFAAVYRLDGVATTDAQVAVLMESRRLIDRAVRWFLELRPATLDIAAEIERYAPIVRSLASLIPEFQVGEEHTVRDRFAAGFAQGGMSAELAGRASMLLSSFQLLDISEIARKISRSPEQVAVMYYALSERYSVVALLLRITSLERNDRWDLLARAALRNDLYATLVDLTIAVFKATADDATSSASERINRWESGRRTAVQQVRHTIKDVRQRPQADLASLSVALRAVRSLVRSAV